jgi:plastocyanin
MNKNSLIITITFLVFLFAGVFLLSQRNGLLNKNAIDVTQESEQTLQDESQESGIMQESVDEQSSMQVPANGSQEPEMIVEPSDGQPSTEGSDSPQPQTTPALVLYSAGVFSPSTLRVSVGTRVTFRNDSTSSTWPASAFHPTHTVYPGSDIAKCGTADQGNIFDSCNGIQPTGEWSFVFLSAGTWHYHNHLNPSQTGTIIVE